MVRSRSVRGLDCALAVLRCAGWEEAEAREGLVTAVIAVVVMVCAAARVWRLSFSACAVTARLFIQLPCYCQVWL